MCTRMVTTLRAWDRRQSIEIVPSQGIGVTTRFPWIPVRAYDEAIQLVAPGGETWQGADAVEQLLNILPRGRWLAWVFRIPVVRLIADRAYRWVARNRHRLGCSTHCRPQSRAG
jgi:predicted DCC family thiol-disulfide oxidoreductase YuxK